jgi:hypothetical protein
MPARTPMSWNSLPVPTVRAGSIFQHDARRIRVRNIKWTFTQTTAIAAMTHNGITR